MTCLKHSGVYGLPKELAINIAISGVRAFLDKNKSVNQVLFCCFDSRNFLIYKYLLEKLS